jgi:hypothetical protein
MSSLGSSLIGGREDTLVSSIAAMILVFMSAILPLELALRVAIGLLACWVTVALLVRYIGMLRVPARAGRKWIPVRFTGSLGRFRLQPRGDGRRVQVVAGAQVVAEAIATDDLDELVVDFEAAADAELDEFGAAIGRAIEMVATADADRAIGRSFTQPTAWRRATPRPRRALLRPMHRNSV